MKKLIILAVMAITTPALAIEMTHGTVLGTSIEQVRAKLSSLGYDVRKSEMEDGKIEIYFVKGNDKGEVYISTATGKVTRIKMK